MTLPPAELIKRGLGIGGLILAFFAVITGHPFVMWAAITLLAASVAIRVFLHMRRRRSE